LLKALSVRAPWASLIADGKKTIEVRSWPTRHRGPLVICQSGGGGAVALVDVIDCRPFTVDDDAASGGVWSSGLMRDGAFAWVLRRVSRLRSEPIKGRLGLYAVDESSFVRVPD
jgi:hypothetical protein